jgi:hypothetical protein
VQTDRKRADRLPAIDFTKGALVLIMVLYHWMNVFLTVDGSVYRYLRFLTPSFIFITGFLISKAYLSQNETSGSRIPKRLMGRGIKLLGIVLLLNLGVKAVHLKSFGEEGSDGGSGFVWTFLTGSHAVAFSVLVPIAYVLMLAAGLLVVSRIYKVVFHATAMALVLLSLALELNQVQSGYLTVFSIGVLGISMGSVSMARIHQCLDRPWAMLLLYILYLSAITILDIIYPLQILGVCLSLAILYWLGFRYGNGGLGALMIRIGKYSLFGYIVQIALLHMLQRMLTPFGDTVAPAAALPLGIALTILAIEGMDWLRRRMPVANRLYSTVFG